MSQLYYQPVALPNVSGAVSNINQAGVGLSTSLRSLGEGITNLGKRRQARIDEENRRAQAGALEALKLVAGNAGSEDQLTALNNALLSLPEDVVLPGAADAVAGRRAALLENDSTRATIANTQSQTRGNIADAVNQELENSGLRNTQKLGARNQAFRDDFSTDLNEISRLYSLEKVDEARRKEQDVLLRAGDRYGTDPSKILAENLDLFDKGAEIRDSNALRDEERLGLTQTRRIEAAQESDANASRDSARQVQLIRDELAADSLVRNEVTDQVVASALTGAISEEDALLRLSQRNDLTAREKTASAEAIRAKFQDDAQALDTYNPLDPNVPTDRIYNNTDRAEQSVNGFLDQIGYTGPDIQLNSNSDIDVVRTAAGVASAGQRVIRANPSFAIFNEIQEIEQSDLTDGAGRIANMPKAIREAYPNLSTPDKWINEINRLQEKHNLSDAATMAIVDRSQRARGANLLGVNMLFGGERADETIIDVDKFDQLAADYTKNNDGTLGGDFRTINDMVGRAGTLSNKITDLETQRQRAQQAGRTADVKRLNVRITKDRDELAGIETRIQGLLPESRGREATTEDVVSGIASLSTEKARQTLGLGGR